MTALHVRNNMNKIHIIRYFDYVAKQFMMFSVPLKITHKSLIFTNFCFASVKRPETNKSTNKTSRGKTKFIYKSTRA